MVPLQVMRLLTWRSSYPASAACPHSRPWLDDALVLVREVVRRARLWPDHALVLIWVMVRRARRWLDDALVAVRVMRRR
eukprot:1156746-Pelagomonas_calceolata.AAC.1